LHRPGFASNTFNYTVNVTSTTSSVNVIATGQYGNATVTINGVAGSSQIIPLNPAGTPTAISILVRARMGDDSELHVIVNR
jgi:hypothetical protein